jgi:transcriptional regulator with XRE-family HTH domain
MANEQLKTALVKAELEPEDLAARLQVDAKTVQRWISGRNPHARHRTKVAEALQVPERQLWPDQADSTGPKDDRAELVAIYASASDVRAPDRRVLLYDARDRVDLLDTTLADIITAPGVIDVLRAKADAGCQINILIAHPQSIWVTTLAQQLGRDQPDDDGKTPLDHELNRSHHLLTQLADHPQIDIRTHWAEHANSIQRFDDHMLVSMHLHHHPATDTPLLHLQRRTDTGLFDQFASHLDAITQPASDPIQTNPDIDFDPGTEPPAARKSTQGNPADGAAQHQAEPRSDGYAGRA